MAPNQIKTIPRETRNMLSPFFTFHLTIVFSVVIAKLMNLRIIKGSLDRCVYQMYTQIREKCLYRFSISGNNLHPCCLTLYDFKWSISFKEINPRKPDHYPNKFAYAVM